MIIWKVQYNDDYSGDVMETFFKKKSDATKFLKADWKRWIAECTEGDKRENVNWSFLTFAEYMLDNDAKVVKINVLNKLNTSKVIIQSK